MSQDNSKTPVVVGTVMHVQAENIPFLKELLQNSPYVQRLIIFKESNEKLWLVSQEGNDGPSR